MDASVVFAIAAGIIIIGFAGEVFFRKTSVPIFVFLILVGIILGPVLNVFPRQQVISLLTPVAELTLVMVLFSSGLNLKSTAILKVGGRALVQATTCVAGSFAVVAAIGVFILKWDLLPSFFFASMISGETTAALLVPLSRWVKISEDTSSFLKIEAAINSIFLVALFFGILNIYNAQIFTPTAAFLSVASQFAVGIVLGGIQSLAWVYLLYRFQREKFTYVLTLALILATYTLATVLGGNGVLAVLVFGVVFGNYTLVNRLFRREINLDFLQIQVGTFQEEISFLLSTFLFVFLGVAFIISPSTIAINLSVALVVVLVLLAFRFAATRVSTFRSNLSEQRRKIFIMCAQGLTPATLGILAVSLQLPQADRFLNILTYIIIVTNVITTAGAIVLLREKGQSASPQG